MTKTATINLLPQEEIENSTFGRTLRWLLTSFRYIVIGTEMVVMGAFLSRFWLDARSSALVDSINQKRAVISSYSSFEEEFRNTQNKLKLFENFASTNQKISPITQSIQTSIPQDIILSEISVIGSKLTVSGKTVNENSISNLVAILNKTNLVMNTKITSISSKDDGSLNFILSSDITERTNGSSS